MTSKCAPTTSQLDAVMQSAVEAEIVVIDAHGVILAANPAWHRFALENSAEPGVPAQRTGVGDNYFAACRMDAGFEDADANADAAKAGILNVLRGQAPHFEHHYPCHSPTRKRWFSMTVRPAQAFAGAVIVHTEITEQKQSEMEAMRSDMFRLLAQNTSDGLAIIENNTIIYASPSYLQVLGYAEHEELGRNAAAILDIIHPADRAATLAKVQAAIASGAADCSYTYRARHKRGHYLWREDSTRFIYDAQGRLLRSYVVAKDISARIESETRLQKANELLRQMEEVANVGGWEIDLPTMTVLWSKQVFRIFECEPSGNKAIENAIDFYVPESQVRVRDAIASALESGSPWDLLLEARTANGNVRWIHSRSQVERAGLRVERIYGSAHDVTAEVLARQALQEQQNSLQICFDNQHPGVAVFARDGLLYCNHSFRLMLGYSADESLQYLTASSLAVATEPALFNAIHEQFLAGRVPMSPRIMRLRKKDASILVCLVSGSVVPWNGVPRLLASVTPVEESDSVELEMRATEARFERLLVSQLEEQQAHIARELHDSVGSRLAGVAMLVAGIGQKYPEMGTELKTVLTHLQTAAEVSRALARGLMPVDASRGAFWRSLERLCLDYQALANVECEFSKEGDFENIAPETANHLYRIAQEAMVNAVKHGHARKISVRLQAQGQQYSLCVADSSGNSSGNSSGTGPAKLPKLSQGSGGIGLKSMRARAKIIGASLRWLANDQGGITVLLSWGTRTSRRTRSATR